jgi:hypothetical protein
VDDVNNMDESMDVLEQSTGGISRRDMIKASVVAGALVWSAPVLLSGTAFAQTGCCEAPFQEVALKFTSANPNCGVTCLDHLVDENVDCCQALADALIMNVTYNAGTQQGGPAGTATIEINTSLATLTGASVRGGGTGQPICFDRVRDPRVGCATFPPDTTTDGRVMFDDESNPSVVTIQMKALPNNKFETINQAEVLLCVKTSISLFC